MTSKLSCDICAVKFNSDSEQLEHVSSLAHHIKQSRAQPTSKRECALCLLSFETLADFSRHLDGDHHACVLDRFRKTAANLLDPNQQPITFPPYESQSTSQGPSRQPPLGFGRGMTVPPWRGRQSFTRTSMQQLRSNMGPPTRGRGDNTVPPPWFPPALPQQLNFYSETNYADDSVPDHMLFQPPTYSNERSMAQPERPGLQFPPGPPAGFANDQWRPPPFYRGSSWRRPPSRRILLQNPVSSIEPEMPLDVRNLAPSGRFNPTTKFTQTKQRQEFLRAREEERAKGKKKKSKKVSAPAANDIDDRPTTSGTGNNSEKGKPDDGLSKTGKNKRKRLAGNENSSELPAEDSAKTPSGDAENRKLEADSTTNGEGTSSTHPAKKNQNPVPLSAAAFLKNRRLQQGKAPKVSDKLLADRLKNYRLVEPTSQTNVATSSTCEASVTTSAVPGNSRTLASTAISNDSVSTATAASAPTGVNYLANARIDANVRQRARELFLRLTPSKRPEVTPTTAASSTCTPAIEVEEHEDFLRQPKLEKPDEFASSSTVVQSSPLISADSSNAPPLPPFSVDNLSLPSSSATANQKDATVSALQELWTLCERQEQIRVEQVQIKDEVERLTQELQRAWFRGKELERQAQEIEQKKQDLLAGRPKEKQP